MYSVVALTGPTCTGKTAVVVDVARKTGAVVLPLDQLQRYKYLSEGVGYDENVFKDVVHKGYQVLSPWIVSGPEKYSDWLGNVLRAEVRERPVLIEGGCTSYLKRILSLKKTDSVFKYIDVAAMNTPSDKSQGILRIHSLYNNEKIQRIVEEVSDLEKLGYITEEGLSFFKECEGLFVHPEHEDKKLAWALRISARMYYPAYLALKETIDLSDARRRIHKNIREIQIYQQKRISSCVSKERIFPCEKPVEVVNWLTAKLNRKHFGIEYDGA